MLGYSDIFQFLLAFVAIVISIVLHELAHGYVALWNGDATAKVNGRLTLNPLAHFDPIGFVMLLLVRFGYAKPVPVNPANYRNRRLGMFTVALAGIATNLVLCFFSVPLWMVCVRSGNAVGDYFAIFFRWMAIININLALFNLLPIFPLDGYRVVESFTRAVNRFNKFMRNYGRYVLVILIGISALTDIFSLPYWCDPIGLYIGFVGDKVLGGFTRFWNLFF